MSKPKDTDIHEPDGIIFSGEKVGHADERSRIRERDGIFFRGEEKGYVDKDKKIRRPDGIIFRGEVVGQVKKGHVAHAEDGIIFSGEEWGYVDEDGSIRQRDGIIFRGRIIGKMRGNNKEAALGYFVLRFKDMEKHFEELELDVRSASNKSAFLGKVRRMLEYVPNADALGDFDGLLNRLQGLEQEIVRQINEHQRKKEQLCNRAESLSMSMDWKGTADALKTLQEEWKTIGSAGRDAEETFWNRFRGAIDKFYQRRTQHFEKRNREWQENRSKKESLCARAESLSTSTDWRVTAEALRTLQDQWKQVGPAGRDHEEALWQRFRAAQDKFYERRSAFHDKRDREQQENLRRKERLCSVAESLAHASDTRAATQQVKELQEEWKTIGHVPRDRADDLWDRFRRACDRVFAHANEERERSQAEWQSKLRETLERKREQAARLRDSIEHDEGNISRWRDTIYNLHDGGRADEIRDSLEGKITDVEDKIHSKRDRLDELEESIRDIESKLRR